jgi:hypothetical protein
MNRAPTRFAVSTTGFVEMALPTAGRTSSREVMSDDAGEADRISRGSGRSGTCPPSAGDPGDEIGDAGWVTYPEAGRANNPRSRYHLPFLCVHLGKTTS